MFTLNREFTPDELEAIDERGVVGVEVSSAGDDGQVMIVLELGESNRWLSGGYYRLGQDLSNDDNYVLFKDTNSLTAWFVAKSKWADVYNAVQAKSSDGEYNNFTKKDAKQALIFSAGIGAGMAFLPTTSTAGFYIATVSGGSALFLDPSAENATNLAIDIGFKNFGKLVPESQVIEMIDKYKLIIDSGLLVENWEELDRE